MDLISLFTKADKKAIIITIILLSLDMFLCGYTIASAVLVLISDGQISAGFAVIPALFTFVCSTLMCTYVNVHVRRSKH